MITVESMEGVVYIINEVAGGRRTPGLKFFAPRAWVVPAPPASRARPTPPSFTLNDRIFTITRHFPHPLSVLSSPVRWLDEARHQPPAAMTSPQPYLLLFRNSGPETHAHLSPDQRQQLVARWNGWFENLVAEGKATEGQPLELETRLVSGSGGTRVVDGPFPEAKEAIGGYVKLMVSGLAEATAIAQRHPGLAYGLVIEVRQLAGTCHLGVDTLPEGAGKIVAH